MPMPIGFEMSAESRAKIAAARRRFLHTPEGRAQAQAAARARWAKPGAHEHHAATMRAVRAERGAQRAVRAERETPRDAVSPRR